MQQVTSGRLPWKTLPFIVGAVTTAIVAYLHMTLYLSVPVLWQDEVNSVNVATLPSLASLWHNLEFDSFPIAWFLLLRTWIDLGPGSTDRSLRLLGFITGLGVLLTYWRQAYRFGVCAPVFSLLLFCSIAPLIKIADSNRAYGLGLVAVLSFFGDVWEHLEKDSKSTYWMAIIKGIFAAQLLYLNSLLIFSILVGAMATAALLRSWTKACHFLVMGMIIASTLLPYTATIRRMSTWNTLAKIPFSFAHLTSIMHSAFATEGSLRPLFGGLLVVGILVGGGFLLWKSPQRHDVNRSLLTYLMATLAVSIGSYTLFLKHVSYPLRIWHLFPFLGVGAFIVDMVSQEILKRKPVIRSLVITTLFLLFLPEANQIETQRGGQTVNMATIADTIDHLSRKEDFLVIQDWSSGITYSRYDRGGVAWMTVPPIDDHRFHRYDLVKEKMSTADALAPLKRKIDETLQGGGRIWLITDTQWNPIVDIGMPADLPPPPLPETNWHHWPYDANWGAQLAGYLRSKSVDIKILPLSLIQRNSLRVWVCEFSS